MRSMYLALPLIAAGVGAGCNVAQHASMWEDVDRAVAVIHPTQGNNVHGTVVFTSVPEGVRVVADLEGLAAGSTHGFHIHEYGDCAAPDGSSAGGHYNPEGNPHGLPDQPIRHAGDLGSITADAQGKAHYELTVDNITIAGLENSIIGRGVIVHAQRDTGEQPTGNAGARIGCGVIGIANPGG